MLDVYNDTFLQIWSHYCLLLILLYVNIKGEISSSRSSNRTLILNIWYNKLYEELILNW